MSATGHTRALAAMLQGERIITPSDVDEADYQARQAAVYAPMDRRVEEFWRVRRADDLGEE